MADGLSRSPTLSGMRMPTLETIALAFLCLNMSNGKIRPTAVMHHSPAVSVGRFQVEALLLQPREHLEAPLERRVMHHSLARCTGHPRCTVAQGIYFQRMIHATFSCFDGYTQSDDAAGNAPRCNAICGAMRNRRIRCTQKR